MDCWSYFRHCELYRKVYMQVMNGEVRFAQALIAAKRHDHCLHKRQGLASSFKRWRTSFVPRSQCRGTLGLRCFGLTCFGTKGQEAVQPIAWVSIQRQPHRVRVLGPTRCWFEECKERRYSRLAISPQILSKSWQMSFMTSRGSWQKSIPRKLSSAI